MRHLLNSYENQIVEALATGQSMPTDFDFTELLMAHYFDVSAEGIKIAEKDPHITRAKEKNRLAGKRRSRFKSIKELFEQWEKWRNSGKVPKRQKAHAEQIKKKFTSKLAEVWKKHSEDFRAGKAMTLEKARAEIKKALDVTESRAAMIVRTETTNYYNKAKTDIYDASPDITHYLFLAIRDKATTAWCTDETRNGKRGRSGLVYAKDDPLKAKETPACHWNCRSEMLPLTPLNPRHQKLIEDDKIKRRNNTCTPLPKGWVSK